MHDASLFQAIAALRMGSEIHKPHDQSFKIRARVTDLDVQELSVDLWIQCLEVGVRWNHALFESQDRLDDPSNTTCAFQMANIRFDRASSNRD